MLNLWLSWRSVRLGNETTFLFGLIKSTPNNALNQQRKEFDTLNEDAQQKIQIIKMMNSAVSQAAFVVSGLTDEVELKTYSQRYYASVLPGISSILTKSKSNFHRIAIFIPEEDKFKIHAGMGYSAEGMQKLRLESDSIVGQVFSSGKAYISGDVRNVESGFRPHPKATKKFNSLLCVPIKCGNITVGVLNMDGEDKDSFTNDDRDFLTYFANSMSVFLYFELQRLNQGGGGNSE